MSSSITTHALALGLPSGGLVSLLTAQLSPGWQVAETGSGTGRLGLKPVPPAGHLTFKEQHSAV